MAHHGSCRLHSSGRWLAAGVALLALAPLVIAAALSPSNAGHGTHRQLGLPACGWQTNMGLPCPTCGMTTSFSHAVRGQFVTAATVQPAGMLLSILVAMTAVGGVWAAVTGAPMQRFASMLLRPAVMWTCITILVLAWGVKLWQAGVVSA